MGSTTGGLPPALEGAGLSGDLDRRLNGKRPAVFLDYDGTLTPIVDRPEDAVISESMQRAVRGLAERWPVCVVSGRDRRVVQELMGIDSLIVAGSHGFDIWSPQEGRISHEHGAEFGGLLAEVKERLRREAGAIEGALVEEKAVSVAVHYRLVAAEERPRIKEMVDRLLAGHPDELKVTPGKMVYEIQPNIDWDKGKAVLHLLEALDLRGEGTVPIYIGDDVTDEHAFEALSGTSPRGIGIFVAENEDPEAEERATAADYALHDTREVEAFLEALARRANA